MKHLLALLSMTVWPFLAQAQEYRVRTGEHDGFTRIAIDAQPGVKWQVNQKDGLISIQIAEHDGQYDIRTVFDRISNKRIGGVSKEQGELTIATSCECGFTTDLYSDDMIVVDISEQYPRQISQTDELEPTSVATVEIDAEDRSFRIRNTKIQNGNSEAETGKKKNGLPLERSRIASGTPEILLEGSRPDTLGSMQILLSQGIGRATTRGILNPLRFKVDLPVSERKPNIDVAIFDSSTSQGPDVIEPRSIRKKNSIRITSSNDSKASQDPVNSFGMPDEHTCLEESYVDVNQWAGTEIFQHEISRLRKMLFSDLDRIKEEVALELARKYVYFGFGSEALRVLKIIEGRSVEANVLSAMAEVLKYGYSKNPEILLENANCGDGYSLWAILSADQQQWYESQNSDAALRELSALPPQLREILSPRLSARMKHIGNREASSFASRTLERLGNPHMASVALLDDDALGGRWSDPTDKEEELKNIIDTNTVHSTQALVKLVEQKYREAQPVGEDIVSLIDAYRAELREGDQVDALWEAHVTALLLNGRYIDAMRVIGQPNGAAGAKMERRLFEKVGLHAVSHGSDGAFLKFVFSKSVSEGLPFGADLNRKISERLYNLGFVESSSGMSPSVSTRYDPEAIGYMENDANLGRSSVQLLPKSNKAVQETSIHEEGSKKASGQASDLEISSGNQDFNSSVSFLRSDWGELSVGELGDFFDLIGIVNYQPPATDDETNSLQASEEAIQESLNFRAVVSKLVGVD